MAVGLDRGRERRQGRPGRPRGREDRQAPARERRSEGQVHAVGQDVDRLGVRDVGDEAEGGDRMEPPQGQVEIRRPRRGQAERAHHPGEDHPDRREDLEPGVVVGDDADPLDDEAGHAEQGQPAEQDPVPGPEAGSVRGGRGDVDPVVVGRRRASSGPAPGHRRQPDEHRQAEDVEDQRVDDVERAPEEVVLGGEDADDVGVDREDHRADEQGDEAPHDREVEPARVAVALADRPVGGGVGDPADGRPDEPPERAVAILAPAPEVLAELDPETGREHDRRRQREEIEQRLLEPGQALEDLARDRLVEHRAADRLSRPGAWSGPGRHRAGRPPRRSGPSRRSAPAGRC